jgi:hypothetical protein
MTPTTAKARAGEVDQNRPGSAGLPTPAKVPTIETRLFTLPARMRDAQASILPPPSPHSTARHRASRLRRGDER